MNRARLVLAALLGLAVGCSAEQTALVLEVESTLPEGTLDSVTFHVVGPGLEPGGRKTEVPLAGRGAKRFPMSLALVHGGAEMGPLRPTIEGRAAGTVLARAPDPAPLYFMPGRTIKHRFVLQRIGAAPSDSSPRPAPDAGAAPPSTPAPDAGAPPPSPPAPDAGAPPPPAPMPMPMPTPPADAGMAPSPMPPPPTPAVVIHAKEIRADLVRARVIHAKEIKAKEAAIVRLHESPQESRWEREPSESIIKTNTLVADEIIVEKLDSRRVEATDVHTQKLDVKGGGDD